MQTLIDVPAFTATTHADHLSRRYQQYSTASLVEPLLSEGWEITTAFQNRTRTRNPEHAKHLVRITHPTLQLGEERLEGLITNSHDGSSSFKFELGAWRIVCSNGLVLGSQFFSVDIHHRRAFEAVKHQAYRLIEKAPEVAAVFDAWKCRETTADERFTLALCGRNLRWDLNAPVEPSELLTIRRDEDSGNDLWSVFNRVQENVTQGGILSLPGRRTPRPIRSIDNSLRINRGLWETAEDIYSGDLVLPA